MDVPFEKKNRVENMYRVYFHQYLFTKVVVDLLHLLLYKSTNKKHDIYHYK